ncbi:Hsp70 family protein [Phytomonospora endophytica]|uniref:Actin-like ATPase involved in cell morphogenesis n=1 Tax=Phytomonospora endophytica TaxID=714109 RepID=A0A841FVT4_9ACTN|nr:Hsp70 family protein [Phytomonospora endophytica]MBB6038873.1 actin-like ATPase involved in cell morphogenesis [Phytomonospora endophytica]GIG68332.1 hypothetical protein Pen01_46270 [Phytomonospora endophytica]
MSVLGVDFGTSHTVAVLRRDDGTTSPLLFDGSPLLPSAVCAEPDGTLLTGRDAVHSARLRPERFEPHPKRRVDDGTVLLGDTEVSVVALFAAVLSRVRFEAARVLGGAPARTIVTHPAVWGPARRLVLSDACTRAGLGPVDLVPEPVAAARNFAARPGTAIPPGHAVVVYDFGGGTFDASVVAAGPTGFEVLAVDGLDDLGGVDIDHALTTHIGARFSGDERWTALTNPADAATRRHHRAFTEDVRTAKERLSRQQHVDLLVPLLDSDTHLTRTELETVTEPLLGRAVRLTQAVMRAAAVPRERIAGVFLVGGSSRMPSAATTLHRGTGIAPTVIDQPELVVATGATMAAPMAPPTPPRPTSPPRHDPRPATPTGGRMTPLEALHWVQLVVMALFVFATVIACVVTPPPVVLFWTMAVPFGLVFPLTGLAATARGIVLIGRDPERAARTIVLTQSIVLGVSAFGGGVLVVMGVPPIPVVRFVPAALIVLSGVSLGMALLGRPPRFIPQWTAGRTPLIAQTAMLTIVALIGLWGWADILSNGPGPLTSPVAVSLLAVLLALTVLAVNATWLNGRGPITASRHRFLLACQWIWLTTAGLYALPWLYLPFHRLIATEGVEEGMFAMSDGWLHGGTADHANDLALWLTVTSAAPTVLAIMQLTRMPRQAVSHPSATIAP